MRGIDGSGSRSVSQNLGGGRLMQVPFDHSKPQWTQSFLTKLPTNSGVNKKTNQPKTNFMAPFFQKGDFRKKLPIYIYSCNFLDFPQNRFPLMMSIFEDRNWQKLGQLLSKMWAKRAQPSGRPLLSSMVTQTWGLWCGNIPIISWQDLGPNAKNHGYQWVI